MSARVNQCRTVVMVMERRHERVVLGALLWLESAVIISASPSSTDFDRVIDQLADLKSNTDTAAIASSHRTTTAAMYSIHSLLSENHP